MKTILYALGALALASTTVQAGDGDGGKVQAERLAVTRGDYSAAPRGVDRDSRPSRAERAGPAATVRLDREINRYGESDQQVSGPRSDESMFRTDRDTVYGD